MRVISVAKDVWAIGGSRWGVNAYLAGDVLFDAGPPSWGGRLVASLAPYGIRAHALTHAHPDHFGASLTVVKKRSVPFWCPERDADAFRSGRLPHPNHLAANVLSRLPVPTRPEITRVIRTGDQVGEFTAIATPGHTPGHTSYWRDDGVLILGDVLFNLDPRTLRTGLREPPRFLTVDPDDNRAAIVRIAKLRPKVVLFGHGPPLRELGRLEGLLETRDWFDPSG